MAFAWQAWRNFTLLFIALSVFVDVIIVAYDGLLARLGYGTLGLLEGVAAIFAVLAVILLARPSLGFTLTLILSALWFIGQLGNAFGPGPAAAAFPKGFTGYILGYGPVNAPDCPYSCPPFVYSALLSILLQIPVIVSAYLGRGAYRKRAGLQKTGPPGG